MSTSDTSTTLSVGRHDEPASTSGSGAVHEEGTFTSQQERRQSKLKGILVRGMGKNTHGTGGASTAANLELTGSLQPSQRPFLEKQETSSRIQQEHHNILKKIEATTTRARKEMDKIHKEALSKENKVRAEIDQLNKELIQLEAEEAKKIKTIRTKEANELEKLVQELRRI
jgi:hypothetical protein